MEIAPALLLQPAQIAAWLATIGFGGMALFQILLALGAPWGRLAWRGQFTRLPAHLRWASLLSAAIFVIGAVCVLARAGIIHVLGQPLVVAIAVWVLVGLFALSTLGNLMSSSPLEKRIMTPIALLLTIACLIVALDL